ncbi:unnamed protein product [Citrullus colocynthis]|uniref:Uncharacterized protein n=1 Tax=Citrullus colocynthis TaxID=252529 RepID=A0ABP0YIX9_9ROSI
MSPSACVRRSMVTHERYLMPVVAGVGLPTCADAALYLCRHPLLLFSSFCFFFLSLPPFTCILRKWRKMSWMDLKISVDVASHGRGGGFGVTLRLRSLWFLT